MNKLIEAITIRYGDKNIDGIGVKYQKNSFMNPNEFVSKKNLIDAFPGLTEARLQKALQRAGFIAKPIDAFTICNRVEAMNVDGVIYYKFNRVKFILDAIAKKRPYVDSLRESYFASCPGKKRNSTAGTISKKLPKSQVIKRLPASLIGEWLKACQPIGEQEYSARNHCETEYREYYDDVQWIETEEQPLRTFLELSDEVNKVLWQCDNTSECYASDYMMSCDNNPDSIVKTLIKFNLIYIDGIIPKPATVNELFELANKEFNNGDVGAIEDLTRQLLEYGFTNHRWDILAALEVGFNKPIDRKQYWTKVYGEQLGKPNVDYWQWLGNKESLEICEELTLLLSLEQPQTDVMIVLNNLPHGINPFAKTNGDMRDFFSFLSRPKFADWDKERKAIVRNAFRQWHEQTIKLFGKDRLESIYKVCYSVSWSVIEDILETFTGEWWEILGVSPTATPQDVKKAYKNLAKIYHPDIYTGGGSKMIIINQAFEDFVSVAFRR